MWLTYTAIIATVVLILAAVFISVSGYRLDRSTHQLAAGLLSEANTGAKLPFHPQQLEGLPDPVKRYLIKAIPEGQPRIQTVRLTQTGFFLAREDSDNWQPFQAVQHFSTSPPGFVWDAKIRMAPLLSARVVDLYRQGTGLLRAKLLNVVTVGEESGGNEVAEGELLRYLAETVWFPTALLPAENFSWEPLDDHSAVATLTDRGHKVRMTFHFNDSDEIVRGTAERSRIKSDGTLEKTSWTIRCSNYQIKNGLRIPLEGQAEWNLSKQTYVYWKGRIEDIQFNPSPEN